MEQTPLRSVSFVNSGSWERLEQLPCNETYFSQNSVTISCAYFVQLLGHDKPRVPTGRNVILHMLRTEHLCLESSVDVYYTRDCLHFHWHRKAEGISKWQNPKISNIWRMNGRNNTLKITIFVVQLNADFWACWEVRFRALWNRSSRKLKPLTFCKVCRFWWRYARLPAMWCSPNFLLFRLKHWVWAKNWLLNQSLRTKRSPRRRKELLSLLSGFWFPRECGPTRPSSELR